MGTLWQDIRYGSRMLARSPGYAAVMVLTLALGISANVTIFGLINGVLLRPFPGQRKGTLVRLYCRSKQPDGGFEMFSYPYYEEVARRSTCFASLSAFAWTPIYLREGEISRRTGAGLVSAEFFDTFGVTMAQGRPFTVEEARPGSGAAVAVISHRLWWRMGRRPDLIGTTIQVNDYPATIVGVLPRTFVSASNVTNYEVWLPLGFRDRLFRTAPRDGVSRLHEHGYRKLFLFGQLRNGHTLASVQPQLQTLSTYLAEVYPAEYRDCTLTAGPMTRLHLRPSPGEDFPLGTPMAALLAVSVAVLLIACLNLANIMLARGLGRRGEIAIRLALGCNRRRIVRQLLTEGALLSLAGGAVALPVARGSAGALVASLERFTGGEGTVPVEVDGRVLAATVGLCLLSVLLSTLGPAVHLAGAGALADLKEVVRAVPRRSRAARQVLIALQIALAFALVTVAGLFVQSVRNAAKTDPGFALDRGLLVELDLNLLGYKTEQGRSIYSAVLERVRNVPGVAAASLGCTVPFGDPYMEGSFRRADASPATRDSIVRRRGEPVSARCNIIGADYFRTLGVPLLRGREFTVAEEQSANVPHVAIVDGVLAQRLWPGEDPIGRVLQQGDGAADVLEVIGVVPCLRDSILEPREHAHVYLPFGRHYDTGMYVHLRLGDIRAETPGSGVRQTILRELHTAAPGLPILGIRTWHEHIRDFSTQYWAMRMGAGLFAVLGGLALLLAGIGIFGVKACLVAQRTREIGIRVALGATRGQTLWLVLREGFLSTLAGTGAGVLLAWVGLRFVRSLLYGVGTVDPHTLAFTALVLAAVVLLASYLPARRAAKVDPMVALRYE